MTALSRWTVQSGDYDVPHLRLRQVASLVSRPRPRSLLDLGCGRGTLRGLVDVERYVGCDFVVPAEAAADFEFHRCDFNGGPLPSAIGPVDAAVCSGLLEYVEDVTGLLSQVQASVLVATYVNMNHVLRAVDVLRGRTPVQHPDWRGMWSSADLVAQIEAAGFRVVEVYETTRGVRPERWPHETVGAPLRLRRAGRLSGLLAHELIYVAEAQTRT